MDSTFATSPAQKKSDLQAYPGAIKVLDVPKSRGLESLSDYARSLLGFCRLAPIMAPPALKN